MGKMKNVALTGILTLLFFCTAKRDNPLDVGSSTYKRPQVYLDSISSSLHKDDTTHFDFLHMIFSGNRKECIFRCKFDSLSYPPDNETSQLRK
jgi:hypothetical protein